ncbi:isocitrate lyase/phosphoenolpyruvate mutase family protein [Streptomyces sp. NPDC048211]|uniref:isocitrate lyase/phosphoenolpyruvate mutase family protein n=1 Tax=Streptomyces sp. NPDC048211 TaxID=3365516 RepID=UPI00370F8F49
MLRRSYSSFRSLVKKGGLVRVVGAHDALGVVIAQQAGFDAVWPSSLEVSAARCIPDAGVITMTVYLDAASNMRKAIGIPVIADGDTGYGNNLNSEHGRSPMPDAVDSILRSGAGPLRAVPQFLAGAVSSCPVRACGG